jgi:hypothetical protein
MNDSKDLKSELKSESELKLKSEPVLESDNK